MQSTPNTADHKINLHANQFTSRRPLRGMYTSEDAPRNVAAVTWLEGNKLYSDRLCFQLGLCSNRHGATKIGNKKHKKRASETRESVEIQMVVYVRCTQRYTVCGRLD